jgi:hypothetical protein
METDKGNTKRIKTGGRQKGAPNKATAFRQQRIAESGLTNLAEGSRLCASAASRSQWPRCARLSRSNDCAPVAFGELAASLSKTLRKNDHVRAEGSVKLEKWNDKGGFQRTCLALIASKVEKINPAPAPFRPTRKGMKNIAERMLVAAGR